MSTPPAAEHALLQRIASQRVLRRHVSVSTAVLVVGVVASLAGSTVATALVIGAILTSVVFAGALAVATCRVREAAIAALARGDALEVARWAPAELTALTGTGHRRQLADALSRCLSPPAGLYADGLSTARAHVRRVPSIGVELRYVMRALERGAASPRAIALVHQLVTDARSPLYSGAAEELRRSVGRISYLVRQEEDRVGASAACREDARYGDRIRVRESGMETDRQVATAEVATRASGASREDAQLDRRTGSGR